MEEEFRTKTSVLRKQIQKLMEEATRPTRIGIVRPEGYIVFTHDPEKDRR